MSNKKITELPILSTPELSGITIVVQDGVTYGSTIGSILPLFSGTTGSSGTSGTSGADGSLNALSLQAVSDAGQYSGFKNGSNLAVFYDWSARQITLTGATIEYYWRGVLYTLTSPWTSSSHEPTTGLWFLFSSNGTDFVWSRIAWQFSYIQVAAVYYQSTSYNTFALRETHELMDVDSHEEFHRQIGTYRSSGCDAISSSYSGYTPTDIANSVDFFPGLINDEDLSTPFPGWTNGNYTLMYIGTTGNQFILDSPLPFSGITFFIDEYSGTTIGVNNLATGTLDTGAFDRYYNVYQIILPTAADIISQKYSMVLLQPQVSHTSIASAQAENPKSISLGTLSSLAPEYVFYSRITYYSPAFNIATGYTNTGQCVLAGISYVLGSRESQTIIDGSSTVSIANPGEGRILTSDDSGSVANAQTKLTFNGSVLVLSGQTQEINIMSDSIVLKQEDDLGLTYIHPSYIQMENRRDYIYIGGIGVDGTEIWIQSNGHESAIDPHNGPCLVILDGDGDYSTVFGLESYTGWTDGHITFYRNIWGTTGMTLTGNTYIDGDIDITGQYLKNGNSISSSGTSGTSGTSGDSNGVLNFVIDGGGLPITTGITYDIEWRFSANITGWSIVADQIGSIIVDIWEDNYDNFPPTIENTITGSEKPTLSNTLKNQDLSLTTWTSSVTTGDWWRINVDSATTVTRVTVSIHYTRT